MRIAIATDHAGFKLKEELKKFLEESGHEVEDFGAHKFDEKDDYPDFVIPAARAVAEKKAERGVVIGSSGQAEGVAANRLKGVRALVYYGFVEPRKENAKVGEAKNLVQVSREDNDSNVLALGASFVSVDEARRVVEEWLSTSFPGEERHVRRIKKIDEMT